MELKNETRESFIFHAEYIEDLPEENKAEFLMYVYNYAIKGIEPELSSFAKTAWIKIKRRIDQERELYEKKCSNLKQRQKKTPDTENNAPETEEAPSDTEKGLSETEKAKSDGEFESEFDNEFVNELETENKPAAPQMPIRESPPMQAYAKKIFDIFQAAGLPCARGNFISFLQRDFKIGLGHLQRHYHSNDVIGAAENYARTVNNPESFITGKYSFDRFVTFKNFVDFLPANYNPENFIKARKDGTTDPPKKRTWKQECPGCRTKALEWDNQEQKYTCAVCGRKFEYEEVNK